MQEISTSSIVNKYVSAFSGWNDFVERKNKKSNKYKPETSPFCKKYTTASL